MNNKNQTQWNEYKLSPEGVIVVLPIAHIILRYMYILFILIKLIFSNYNNHFLQIL